ncbi:MAG: phytanoyl-CoA dioxygenase family protein [Alphaproteobacteria bacterium]|nr:phytanoyl-CoA dioxygenase family protein [Alphaproteobacteria bacterium]
MLTAQQIAAYRRDGYSFPHRALSEAELSECRDGLARYEAWLGKPVNQGDWRWRSAAYAFLPWLDRLIRHPAILDAVEDLVGRDILVFTTTFFIKEAHSPTFAAWHQDATYFGIEPYEHVTAWVALTDATEEAGCMEVVPERGRPRQLHHGALGLKDSINGGGQAVVEEFDRSGSVMMAVPAGSFSLHHTLCTHRSAPNRAAHRRVGIGISYIPAHCRITSDVRMRVPLVRGRNSGGHFDILPPPSEGEFHPTAIARHEEAYRLYRENYAAQIEKHDREYGATPAGQRSLDPNLYLVGRGGYGAHAEPGG